jgi:DNA-binding NarL/FixJ family response regulator
MKFFSVSASTRKNQTGEFDELTEREFEILEFIAHGDSNKEISRKLFLSVKTVQNYVSLILMKLQVADRSHAIIRAREAGLGKTE